MRRHSTLRMISAASYVSQVRFIYWSLAVLQTTVRYLKAHLTFFQNLFVFKVRGWYSPQTVRIQTVETVQKKNIRINTIIYLGVNANHLATPVSLHFMTGLINV